MQYSATHKSLVYRSADPVPILATIPDARRIGADFIAVPFNLRNGQIMRHLGYEAISPIQTEYDFPSKYPSPRPQQIVMAGFHTLHPRCMNVSHMRVGKTLSTLWAADWLMSQGLVHKALILSPLSTLKTVWENEVYSNFHGRRKAAILYGDRAKRMKMLDSDVDFFVLNHDGLCVGTKHEGNKLILGPLAQELIARHDIDLIIIDEASAYKNSSTRRWKILNRIIETKPDGFVWGLTGSPAPGAPTDAWGIARLVYGKARKPESFQGFRMRTMYRQSEFKWRASKGAEQAVYELLQPAVRFTRKDMGFPPVTYETRDVELSKKQKDAYAAMKKDLELWTHDGRRIDAVNEGVLRTKLIQIACGAVYGADGTVHDMDAKNKLDALDDIIEESDGKIIVFSPFTSTINMLSSHISKTVSCAVVNGETAFAQRNKIFQDFTGTSDPRVLIADARAMGHGIDLRPASTVVWFGPIDSLEYYEQANSRVDGPDTCAVVIHLASSPVEREIYRRLQEKKTLQGAILDLLRGN